MVIKEQQHHPVRGDVTHLDCLEVRLDEEIEAEVAIELEGADNAPGVREGVLEHVTREVTVEALPTAIPEQIVVDVSEMEINDTINLASVSIPSGVKLMADEPEEITIATLSPPRVEEEPEPEVEEEAESSARARRLRRARRPPRARARPGPQPRGEGRRRGFRRRLVGLLDRLFGRRGRGSGGRDDSWQYNQPQSLQPDQGGAQGEPHHHGGQEGSGEQDQAQAHSRPSRTNRPRTAGRLGRAGRLRQRRR